MGVCVLLGAHRYKCSQGTKALCVTLSFGCVGGGEVPMTSDEQHVALELDYPSLFLRYMRPCLSRLVGEAPCWFGSDEPPCCGMLT